MRKLRDMDIDEISLVDRAANQHASILFSKALNQEDEMPDNDELYLYDEDGQPVDTESLEFGDVVYDQNGAEMVIVPEDGPDEVYAEDLEPELVGKAMTPNRKNDLIMRASFAPLNAARHVGQNAPAYGAGAGGLAVGYGTGKHRGRKKAEKAQVEKSFGELLVEELSKSDRDERDLQLAATLGDEIEKAQARADQAVAYAAQLEDERITEAFISKAAEYNLPVDPTDLGLILKAAATVLTDDQLDLLDQLFEAIGDDIYNEIGAVGDTDNSDVLSQVDQFAAELVGKSEGGLSMAEASTMLFEQNPAAYEEYLRENGGY